jgi:hypothetical protein
MRLATVLGTLGLLMSTTAQAQDVSYDYDRHTDFRRLQSYVWAPGTPEGQEINHRRITSAVDSQLTSKGLRQAATPAGADLVVVYHVVVSSEAQVSGSRPGPARWASARVEEVPVATLMVELLDAETHAVVWRGMVSRDVDTDASPEQREKNIAKAVEKLFKHYPPAK